MSTDHLARLTELDDRSARLFAADCAEHVLPLFETKAPNDQRPRQAIEVARRFAMGEATVEELTAARFAASSAYLVAAASTVDPSASRALVAVASAARAAYLAVAPASVSAAEAAEAAEIAVGTAATRWTVCGVTARASRSAERAWQAARLNHYLTLQVEGSR